MTGRSGAEPVALPREAVTTIIEPRPAADGLLPPPDPPNLRTPDRVDQRGRRPGRRSSPSTPGHGHAPAGSRAPGPAGSAPPIRQEPRSQRTPELDHRAPAGHASRESPHAHPVRPIRRILKHPRLMHYNRLIAVVLAANLALAWFGLNRGGWWSGDGTDLAALSYAALGNFALAVLIRQQYVINLLFRLATSAPTSWPLKIRWMLAKVYHFGGLHVGGGVAGTLWFGVFVGSLTHDAVLGMSGVSAGTIAVSYALVALLFAVVATAVPPVRARRHDLFERTHRFGGWAALVLFWTQTVLFTADGRGERSLARALMTAPGTWILVILTASVALPWLRLRKVAVDITRPSSHVALVRFDHDVTPFAGSSTAVSRNPLLEWHSFANVPAPDRTGFRLAISRAGDWTGKFVDDTPSHVWVKGIPTAGVANIEVLFTKVVYVATGSGIGPVLPHLLAAEVPSHLVWATRSPRATYGDELVDEILSVQPHATIWDTTQQGKPDMVRMAYETYASFGAEAVICISNKQLTWQVVHGMESLGIPAYGAIWDS